MNIRRQPLRAPAPPPARCLGCTDCRGVCAALLQLIGLPDAVLNRPPRP